MELWATGPNVAAFWINNWRETAGEDPLEQKSLLEMKGFSTDDEGGAVTNSTQKPSYASIAMEL